MPILQVNTTLHYTARSRSGLVANRLVTAAADGCSRHLKQAKVFARISGGYVHVKILIEGQLRKIGVLCAVCLFKIHAYELHGYRRIVSGETA